MKQILCLIFLLQSCLTFGQTEELSEFRLTELFKEINNSDRSNLDNPKVREEIFLKNFDTIIWLIQEHGYPNLTRFKKEKKLKRSIENGISRTFTHILQTQPEKLLNAETIRLLKNEISNGRMSNLQLKDALKVFQYDNDIGRSDQWNQDLSDLFYLAIREWDIKLYSSAK